MEKLEKIFMHASLYKSASSSTGYTAVLSDDSVDRDGEVIGKSFLQKALDGQTLGFANHENNVLNIVCRWKNKRIEVIKGHNALVAEPEFFDDINPAAKQIKGMLDKGVELGVSITALPNDYDDVKVGEKLRRTYTDGEILTADFVGVQSNKHAMALSRKNLGVAKALNLYKEESTMENVNVEEMQKQLDAANAELAKIKKDAEQASQPAPAAEVAKSFTEEDMQKAIDAAVKRTIDSMSVQKAPSASPVDNQAQPAKKDLAAEAIEKGFLPVLSQ